MSERGGYKGLELWQCYWDQEKVEKIKKLGEKEPSIMKSVIDLFLIGESGSSKN